MGAAPRPRHRAHNSHEIGRPFEDRGGHAISRAPPAGTTRVARGGMEDLGKRTTGEVLPPDPCWQKATHRRAVELGTPAEGDSSGHAADRGVKLTCTGSG